MLHIIDGQQPLLLYIICDHIINNTLHEYTLHAKADISGLPFSLL